MAIKNLTEKRIVAELEKAKIAMTPTIRRLMNSLTRLPKDILAPFGIAEDDFKGFVAWA